MFKPIRLRFRRRLRKGQRQVEDLGVQAEQGLDRNLLRRFSHLAQIKRFVIGWVGLLVLLIVGLSWQLIGLSRYYQTVQPVPGGIYTEGIPGAFTTANPLYATSAVDTTVSRLIFSGLFKYNNHNKLVGDLASSYSVDSTGHSYTVHLRPGLVWQDGQRLTSADVLFTYQAIQNPDAQSPMQPGWAGIGLKAPNSNTIVFTLPNVLASFPDSLTNGIVPQHLLKNVALADLRTVDFNTSNPIGSGPFRWHAVQVAGGSPNTAQEQIALLPFNHYVGGQPKLKEFIVHAFANPQQLIDSFNSGQLTAAAGLDALPIKFKADKSRQVHNLLFTAGSFVFFKTSSGPLADAKLRQALVLASNPAQIIRHLGYLTHPVREPLLEGQLGYDPAYAEKTNDLAAAKDMLNQDGWIVGAKGIRFKSGQPLEFELSLANTPENNMVANRLSKQWRALGVKLQIQSQSLDDFTTTLSTHGYDAVLYGISIGTDPDVFPYWSSSQADVLSANRLNLSEYKSTIADSSLAAGRTRLDPSLRAVKYQPFLQAWQQDAPALGLYQPRYLYITRGTVYGLTDHSINVGTDRFSNVQNWEIWTANVTN